MRIPEPKCKEEFIAIGDKHIRTDEIVYFYKEKISNDELSKKKFDLQMFHLVFNFKNKCSLTLIYDNESCINRDVKKIKKLIYI